MLPQMSPLPWLIIFIFMFFLLFSMNLFMNSFKPLKSVMKGKLVLFNESVMPW